MVGEYTVKVKLPIPKFPGAAFLPTGSWVSGNVQGSHYAQLIYASFEAGKTKRFLCR